MTSIKYIISTVSLIAFGYLNTAVASTDSNPVINLDFKKKSGSTSRPKLPSQSICSATYADGYITFFFTNPEGECKGMLTDNLTGNIVYLYFNSEYQEPIEVGYHQSASITVTTEAGNTYYGEW